MDRVRRRFIQGLAPEWKMETELIDHDSLTAWLWTYWEGRCYGYW